MFLFCFVPLFKSLWGVIVDLPLTKMRIQTGHVSAIVINIGCTDVFVDKTQWMELRYLIISSVCCIQSLGMGDVLP